MDNRSKKACALPEVIQCKPAFRVHIVRDDSYPISIVDRRLPDYYTFRDVHPFGQLLIYNRSHHMDKNPRFLLISKKNT